MPRIRTIKPEFWSSLTITSLTTGQRLTFIGLWNFADDAGRMIYDPRLVKSQIWPLDDAVTAEKVAEAVQALADADLVQIYTIGNRTYLQVRSWDEHQSISKPRKSAIPAPSDTVPGALPEASRNVPGALPEASSRERNGKEGKGKEPLADAAAPAGDIPATKRDLLFEAIVDACGWQLPTLTKTARGRVNHAVKELRDLDATPDQVKAMVRAYRQTYNAEVTPQAITGNWARFAKPAVPAAAKTTCSWHCGQPDGSHDDLLCRSVTGRKAAS